MRFYVLRPDGKTVECWIRIKVLRVDKDLQLGIDSGDAFGGSHFVLLDYDNGNPKLEFEEICKRYGFKRGLIVRSSEGHYHAISFSPTPWVKYKKVLEEANIDPKHKSCSLRFGFSTLRISQKNGSVPEVVDEVINMNGTNFYSWDHERAYLDALKKKINMGKEVKDEIPHISSRVRATRSDIRSAIISTESETEGD